MLGLMAANVAWLADYPRTPGIYRSGVRYQMEPRGSERWQGIAACLARGVGDCEDLACWRAAELRAGGTAAMPSAIWRPVDGRIRAHAFVALPDGSTEDPSEVLGMRPLGLHRPDRPWAQIPFGRWQT
jgi:hypothetical protein